MATGASEGQPRTPPVVRVARWVLFAILLLSAGLTLFGLPELQRAVAAGRWPPATLAVPVALLGLFAVGYAGYRIVLVRAGRYPAGKALVRIAVMAAVVGAAAGLVLLPPEGPADRAEIDLAGPLLSANPEVRALAAELVRHRPRRQALAHVDRLVDLVEDASPEVRRQARRSLTVLAGKDVGGGEGPGAAARWREHWRRGRPR